MVNLASLIIELIVSIIIVAPVLWLVGRALVGNKASLTHAIWIVALGIIINAILGMFIHGIVGLIVTLIVWLWLVKHFFNTGWLHAIIIAVVAIIALVIIAFILAAIGFSMLAGFIRGVAMITALSSAI